MQEDIESRAVNLVVSTGRITAQGIISAVQMYCYTHPSKGSMKKQQKLQEKIYKQMHPRGKMSVKKLLDQGEGAKNIEIEDTKIGDFRKIAGKYGIDYAVTKDRSHGKPRYLVFFKAKDNDVLQAAFDEYAYKQLLKKERQKPSIRKTLERLKEAVKKMPIRAKHREVDHTL